MITTKEISNLHDGEITSLSLNRKKEELEISIWLVEEDIIKKLNIGGVTKFHATNMRLQNVILDSYI